MKVTTIYDRQGLWSVLQSITDKGGEDYYNLWQTGAVKATTMYDRKELWRLLQSMTEKSCEGWYNLWQTGAVKVATIYNRKVATIYDRKELWRLLQSMTDRGCEDYYNLWQTKDVKVTSQQRTLSRKDIQVKVMNQSSSRNSVKKTEQENQGGFFKHRRDK